MAHLFWLMTRGARGAKSRSIEHPGTHRWRGSVGYGLEPGLISWVRTLFMFLVLSSIGQSILGHKCFGPSKFGFWPRLVGAQKGLSGLA